MSLIRYTPFLSNFQQEVNRLLDQYNTDVFGQSEELGGGMFAPAMDVKEDPDAYTVHVEVPGVLQEKINITLQDNILTIRGHKEQKLDQNEAQFRRVERSYGSFARSLTLPRNVDGSAVTANLHEGVLEIRLPKQEEAKPRQINVGTTTTAPAGAADQPTASGTSGTSK